MRQKYIKESLGWIEKCCRELRELYKITTRLVNISNSDWRIKGQLRNNFGTTQGQFRYNLDAI